MNDSGYDDNGKPVDFTDGDGIHWIYVGKESNGADHWMGEHREK